MNATDFVVFEGARLVARGDLATVLPTLKQRFDEDAGDNALVFDVASGKQVDFDLRGCTDEVLARASGAQEPRGPGRPRLGVTAREVTLLPRHWAWLEEHPSGASAALRRLVEDAMKANPGAQAAQRTRDALSRMLTALAGNRPHYEEASRALFAGDLARFESLVAAWPKALRSFAVERARLALAPESTRASGSDLG